MNTWLQRTVGTASIACGIALAASGIAYADDKPVSIGGPLGAADSLPNITDVTGGLTQGAGAEADDRAGSITPGARVGKPENEVGMGADLVGSKVLGHGAVGGLRDDVSRPAEDLPLLGRLPAIGQLGSAVPLGNSPLGVDRPAGN